MPPRPMATRLIFVSCEALVSAMLTYCTSLQVVDMLLRYFYGRDTFLSAIYFVTFARFCFPPPFPWCYRWFVRMLSNLVLAIELILPLATVVGTLPTTVVWQKQHPKITRVGEWYPRVHEQATLAVFFSGWEEMIVWQAKSGGYIDPVFERLSSTMSFWNNNKWDGCHTILSSRRQKSQSSCGACTS